MKKAVSTLVAICVSLFVLSACSFVNSPIANQDSDMTAKADYSSAESNIAETNSDFSVEPPQTLIFNNMQEYYDFVRSVNFGKEEFVSYIIYIQV